MVIAEFKLNNKYAKLPTKKYAYDIGSDIYSCETKSIAPRSFVKIETGLYFQGFADESQNQEYYIRIAPRSGMALKHGIDVLAGVVDKNYRGEIGVLLINNSDEEYIVRQGDRIAQIIFERAIVDIEMKEVTNERGSERLGNGFGSSGV